MQVGLQGMRGNVMPFTQTPPYVGPGEGGSPQVHSLKESVGFIVPRPLGTQSPPRTTHAAKSRDEAHCCLPAAAPAQWRILSLDWLHPLLGTRGILTYTQLLAPCRSCQAEQPRNFPKQPPRCPSKVCGPFLDWELGLRSETPSSGLSFLRKSRVVCGTWISLRPVGRINIRSQ